MALLELYVIYGAVVLDFIEGIAEKGVE